MRLAIFLSAIVAVALANDPLIGGYPAAEEDDLSVVHEMRLIKTLVKRPRHTRRDATLSAPVFMTFNGDIEYPGLYTFVTNTADKCPSYEGDLPKFSIKVQVGEPFLHNGVKGWNPNIVIVDYPEDRKTFFLTRYNRAYLQDGESALQKLNQRYNGAVNTKTVTISLEEGTGFLNLTMDGVLSVAIKGRQENSLQLAELKVQVESYTVSEICGIAKVVGEDGTTKPMKGDLAGWAEKKPFRQSTKKGANWAAKWAAEPMASGFGGSRRTGGNSNGGNSGNNNGPVTPAVAAPPTAVNQPQPDAEASVPPELEAPADTASFY